ncbi:MAG: hypothetical protein ACJAYU_003458 [Bradymonadia bacterium]|jgi:hypothetical protein
MRVVVATTDIDWAAPLTALLREKGMEVEVAADIIDAMAVLAEPTVGLVVHSSIGADEARLAVKSVSRRFGDRIRVVGVGPLEGVEAPPEDWRPNPYLYVKLVEFLTTGLAESARESGDHTTAPRIVVESVLKARTIETLGDVSRVLQIARYGSYFELLDVSPDSGDAAIVSAAAVLREVLDEETVPSHVVDVCYEELAEVRAAVEDAAGVLTSRRARAAYVRELAVD